MSGIISKRRNELIISVLVSCNVMEAAGTGFDKIVEEYRNAGETHRPYIYSSSDHFTLVLPDLTYRDGVEDSSAPALLFAPAENGTNYDEKVLSFCYYQARKACYTLCLHKLTENDRARLQELYKKPEYRTAVEYMLKNNVKLEQEIVSLNLMQKG